MVGLGHNTFCSCCNSQCMACERTHVDDTSYRRLVVKEKEAFADERDHVFDLTSYDSYGGSVRMIRYDSNARADISTVERKMNGCSLHHACCEKFDISTSDNDDDWTEAPWLHGGLDDIVLDRDADVSTLPLSFADVGVPCTHDGSLFVDAQGNPLEVYSTRLARVRLGNVVFKEKFIVSGVTTPLLSLGSGLRGGWSMYNEAGSQRHTKDDIWIPLFLKRNSL